ncbi:MAG: hypothetical protein JWO67_1835 [Streptosporangiaceae bacterium]|nr:hypothetical protein [Streptosporangiaceae bacterium]
MELRGVPIRRARAQLIRTVQVGRGHLRAGTPRLEFVTRVPCAAQLAGKTPAGGVDPLPERHRSRQSVTRPIRGGTSAEHEHMR